MKHRKLRIAWSVACLSALAFLLPDADSAHPSGWFVPILIGLPVLAIASWIPLQYSLRTLLIATTLIAIGLGLIAWLQ